MSTNETESSNDTAKHGKPTEFMSCLVTMEDITEDAGNYGTWLV